MKVITVTEVSEALYLGLQFLRAEGILMESRNGPVLVAPCPVTTVYTRPQQRVLFSSLRDANPFFHLMEALWMLWGANDLSWPQQFNSNFGAYSDDDTTVWGAYGWRWRRFFGYDQLDAVVHELQRNPQSRRCVISMWNAAPHILGIPYNVADTHDDFAVGAAGGKDVPCNTHIYVDLMGGVLNITVCNRSNDIIWGAYGANAVHMSILQEYLAARVGVPVGIYRQVSNNYHLYTATVAEKWGSVEALMEDVFLSVGEYLYADVDVTPLFQPGASVDSDLQAFKAGVSEYQSDEFELVVEPMYRAWLRYKQGNLPLALSILENATDYDWLIAARQWMQRRIDKRSAK